MSSSIISKGEIRWQPSLGGAKFDVPIDYYASSGALESGADPALVFLGYGEEKWAIKMLLKRWAKNPSLPEIVCIDLPDRILKDTEIIELAAKESATFAIESINDILGRPLDTATKAVGHSKGAGVLLNSAVEAPDHYDSMGLISPIGVTNESLGKTMLARKLAYFWRLGILNNMQKYLYSDPSNVMSFYEVGGRIAKDLIININLNKKFNIAYSMDLADNIRTLGKDRKLIVFEGKTDKLFTPDDFHRALGAATYNEYVELVEGSHSPIHGKVGTEQVMHAARRITEVSSVQ